ncbi:MAG: Ig-like domain-containing protein, partial [Spirochaetota bacterium]
MGTRVTAYIAFVAFAALTLAGCSNPVDLRAIIEENVTIATAEFLEVVSVSPAKHASDVNPGADIAVEFNLPLDTDTVTDTTVAVSSSAGTATWTSTYNEAARTLRVEPDPYLDGEVEYTVRLAEGLAAASGQPLAEDYAWSFTTRNYPAGSVTIADGAAYTNDGAPSVRFQCNDVTAEYCYAFAESALDEPSIVWHDAPALEFTVDVSLPTGDGTKEIFVRFRDGDRNASEVSSDTVFLDQTPPDVDAGSKVEVNMYVELDPPPTISGTANDAASGVAAVRWEKANGSGTITFTSSTSLTTGVTASADDAYTLRLRATDGAGNESTAEREFVWDRTPPPRPSMGSLSSPTSDRTPTWTWSPGTDSDGSGQFRYGWSGEYWFTGSSGSTATSYTPSGALSHGTHTLAVCERDAVGNWSEQNSRFVFVDFPVEPEDGATGVVRTPKIDWYDAGGFLPSYDLYGRAVGLTGWELYGSNLSYSHFYVPWDSPLPANTTI